MFRRVVLAAAMSLMLVSCASDTEAPQPLEKPAEALAIVLHFDAVAWLNPGANGQPTPVRVRIYELKNSANFSRADYFALAERAQATLGSDLIEQDEVLIRPGQQLTITRELNAATRKIGLVVGYREIDQANWRTGLDVMPLQAAEFQVGLDTRGVSGDRVANSIRPAQ